jgi:hypothetical protein
MDTPEKTPTPEPTTPANKAGFAQLENLFDEYLVKKAPALPANIKELLVNFAPWIIIISIILAVPAILAVLGFGTLFAPLGYVFRARLGLLYILSIIFLLVTLLIRVMALPGLFNRTRKAWNLLYYSVLLNAVYSLLTVSIVGFLLGTLISLYLLFQVKEYYK